MKTLILFLIVLVSFSACKKGDTDVKPQNAADAVAGSYSMTSFRYVSGSDVIDLPKMPYTQSGKTISGTIDLTPTSEESVSLIMTLKVTGEQDQSIDISNLDVKKRGSVYGLYVDDELVADASGSDIIFNLDETDPQTNEKLELKFTAKK